MADDEAISEIRRGMDRKYFVYIMTNKNNTCLYTGVTNNLKRRVYEHKEKMTKGFSKRYNINKLVYYEVCDDAYNAHSRETDQSRIEVEEN